MNYIVEVDTLAVIFQDETLAKETGLPVLTAAEIPEGEGLLKTDGVTLWWEPVPAPVSEPVDELGQLKETVTALQGENAALQEAVDLLTLAILEG